MSTKAAVLAIRDLRGGRNDTDPPLSLPDDQCTEALNVDWSEGTLAHKRPGSTAVTDTGGTAFSSGIQSLFRFVPGADETAAELWGIDGAATPIVKRMAAGTSFADVTLSQAIATKPQEVTAAVLNGKLFLAYDSTKNRMHVYDPKLSSPRVRVMGLRQDGVAPSAADSGAGTYAATARYYRVRWVQTNYAIGESMTSTNANDGLRIAAGSTRLAQGFQLDVAGTVLAFEGLFGKGGTAVGNVWVTIEGDSSGSPDGTPIQTSDSLMASAVNDSTTTYTHFTFANPVLLSAATQYHIVLYGDYTISGANFIAWRGNSSTQYAEGSAKDFDGASWSAATNCADFIFKLYASQDGSIGPKLYRRSEASRSFTFTPSGSGTHAVVTQPTVPSEQETHWELEASSDNATFYLLYGYNNSGYLGDAIPIATTTANDTATTSQYSGGALSDAAGMYALPISVKHLLSDGNRLLMAGAWESGFPSSTVYFTPVLGSADRGDDERVPNQTSQKNFLPVSENDGGGITALMGPLNGTVLVGKYRQLWMLRPTSEVSAPYIPRKISDWVGVVAPKAWCVSRDEAGRPAVYFLSTYGPYRFGESGLQYLGRDNETTWNTVNLGATGVVAWVCPVTEKHQVWFHIATGSANDPDVRMVFDVLLGRLADGNQIRGGWSKHTGNAPSARCGTLFANTLGASMSRDLKPYIGRASGTAIQKADSSATDDAGTNFQAYVTCKPFQAKAGYKLGVGASTLLAKAATGVTISQTINRDFGLETPTAATVLLTASGSETRVFKKFEAAQISGADVIQLQIGDGSAASNTWTLDEVTAPIDLQEAR